MFAMPSLPFPEKMEFAPDKKIFVMPLVAEKASAPDARAVLSRGARGKYAPDDSKQGIHIKFK